MATLRRTRAVFLLVPFILLFYFLALDSLVGDSPTMDEQNHLARGLAILRTGDPRFNIEHPPFINALSALPVLTVQGLRLPLDHPSWNQTKDWYSFADQLLWHDNDKVGQMIFLARLPIVFLTIGLALAGFRFGKELWEKNAALIAFILLLFDPNILAHGRYSTTDVGGTLFILLSSYLLWRLWTTDKWHWGRLAAAGVFLGLAFSSKYLNLVFVPIFAFLAILPVYPEEWQWRSALRRLGQLIAAGIISIPVIWALFAFQWGQFSFAGTPLSDINSVKGPMPVFWAGIEQILRLSAGGRANFLLGETSLEGWWYYFPLAFLVKTPLIVILLSLVAAILLLVHDGTRKRAAYLLLTGAMFFLIIMQSNLNIGYRHLMPLLPYLYLLIAGLSSLWPGMNRLPRRITKAAILFTILGVIIIDLLIHPHYLSYFNLAAGGPSNGHRVLVDSNIDWGQDLLRLKDWVDENNVDDLKLAWFGSADPAYYGIEYQPLPGLPRHFNLWWDPPFDPENPETGTYAISVSNLWELPLMDKYLFSWFRNREPDHRIGYSIYIYVVE